MTNLNKRKLKLVEVQPFPPVIEISQLSQEHTHNTPYQKRELKYVYTAKMYKHIMVMTLFNITTSKAYLRMFFNKSNFVTQMLGDETKWSRSTLKSLWYETCYLNTTVCANSKSAKIIQRFFGSEDEPYVIMDRFQQNLRQKQLAQRHKKETDVIDERMKAIRSLPKTFARWLNEVPLNFSRYIYYRRVKKRLIKGYCTSCSKDVEFYITEKTPWTDVRHNNPGRCPCCKKAIVFKAEGKTGCVVDRACGSYIQKTETGFVLRYFDITKRYSNKSDNTDYYRHPKLTFFENGRHFFDRDDDWLETGKHYEFGIFKQTNVRRWCKSRDGLRNWRTPLYTQNLKYVLKDTPWQHSAICLLAKNAKSVSIHRYLREYRQHPAYEYLVKAHLYNLISEEMLNSGSILNFKGRNLPEILGISKTGFKQFQNLNGSCAHLKLIRIAESLGMRFTDDQLHILVKMELYNELLKDLLEITTPQRVINYINRNLAKWESHRANNAIDVAICWRDYLKNCKLMGYDTDNDFIIFPRNLKARHDELVAECRVEKNTVQERVIAWLHQPLQEALGYTHKKLGLVAIAPSSRGEIINEGETLRHCVHTGSYLNMMVEGKGYILFVRKSDAPNVPFYTAEIVDGVIRQCRGEGNDDMTDDVKKFIGHWQTSLNKKNAKTIKIAPAAYAQAAA